MATDGTKLNQLPELTTLSDATMLYAVDGGEDYHVNFETIKDETVPEVFTPTTNGLVPHPNSGNGGKVLRGDGTWQGTFDSSNDGLVPKLGTNDKDNVLRGDGTWVANDKLIGTGSGSLVTFDAIEAPMPSLKVSVEAKQDLHGYDSPWVGGAGKNKLLLTVDRIKSDNTSGSWSGNTYSINGAEYKINTDNAGNVISISARNLASNPNGDLRLVFTLSSGSYILSSGFTETNGTNDSYLQKNRVTIARGNNSSPGPNFTLDSSSEVVYHLRLSKLGDSSYIAYPMIHLASVTDSTFAPYTNVCPISGWDAANVSDVGKNLFDTTTSINNTYINNNGEETSYPNWYASTYVAVKPNTEMTFIPNSNAGDVAKHAFYNGNKEFISAIDSGEQTFTTPSNCRYMRFSYRNDSSDIQLKLVSTTTIALPQTVYGGELDVVNGELTVTSGYIASYDGETLPSTWISSMDEYAEGTSPTTGAEVCYELANPIIINLTPTLIKSLNGQNNLSVDCGEIIEGEYQRSITEAINALEAGGGGSYEETTLWSGMAYATNTQLNLDGNISDYDQINFQVYRKANNYPDQLISCVYLKSALTVGETIAIWGYGNGDYLYMTISADNKIVISAGYGQSFSIRKIVGVKY